MKVQIEVSLGELVDKVSILRIKQKMITDTEKLKLVNQEERLLTQTLESLKLEGIEELLLELSKVNQQLWKIEDDIRDCERDKKFEKAFIELARAVYHTKDKRFEIKNQVNLKYGSEVKEVKSYQQY